MNKEHIKKTILEIEQGIQILKHQLADQQPDLPKSSSESEATQEAQPATSTLRRSRTSRPTPPIARLLKPFDTFVPGEARRLYWLDVRGPCVVYISPANVAVNVFELGGGTPDTFRAAVLSTSERFPEVLGIAFNEPDRYFISVARNPEWLEEGFELEFAIRYAEPSLAYSDNAITPLPDTTLRTPFLFFPDGTEAFDCPARPHYGGFLECVTCEYGSLLESVSTALYDLAVELPLLTFPIPPAGAGGPRAPSSARHNENYCGISAFIHSMQSKFPGALPPNAHTDPTEWDKVGDALDHSNTFGERGSKMVDNINKNFRDKQGAADGKRYCAEQLTNSAASIWSKRNCDLKLLVYDLPTFGHWVDINSVTQTATGVDLNVQDYGHNYTVPYNDAKDTIDLTNAAGSTMGNRGKEFGGRNPLQRIYFVAVCECPASTH